MEHSTPMGGPEGPSSPPKNFIPHLSLETPSTPSIPCPYPFRSHPRILPTSAQPSGSRGAPVPQPHSQIHLLCLLFYILTPQLLLPGRIWKRGILSMGTAGIRHIRLWGQRRKSRRGQRREGSKRPSRDKSGASQGPRKGGD